MSDLGLNTVAGMVRTKTSARNGRLEAYSGIYITMATTLVSYRTLLPVSPRSNLGFSGERTTGTRRSSRARHTPVDCSRGHDLPP